MADAPCAVPVDLRAARSRSDPGGTLTAMSDATEAPLVITRALAAPDVVLTLVG